MKKSIRSEIVRFQPASLQKRTLSHVLFHLPSPAVLLIVSACEENFDRKKNVFLLPQNIKVTSSEQVLKLYEYTFFQEIQVKSCVVFNLPVQLQFI